MSERVAHDKVCDHSNHKILSPKQMFQWLAIALTQVKADNTSENVLNETRQIIYSLYRTKDFNTNYSLVITRFQVQYDQYYQIFSYFADLFHEPLAEYEKHGKYWPYCGR